MKISEKITTLLSNGRDPKGFNALPVFLNPAAYSGFTMERSLDYKYDHFLFDYKNGFCEMSYFHDDLERLWQEIQLQLEKDPDYIRKCRSEYDKNVSFIEKVDGDYGTKKLRELSDEEIVKLVKSAMNQMIESVGIGHMIEAVSYGLERNLRQNLESEISDKTMFNYYFSVLTAPTKKSFITQEEDELRKIGQLSDGDKESAFKKHLERYFWIQNSYVGAVKLSMDYFADKLAKLVEQEVKIEPRNEKDDLIESLGLTKQTVELLRLIDEVTIWQDDRKSHILKAISRLNFVLEELSRRVGIGEAIYYLGATEVLSLKSISELTAMAERLNLRKQGVFFLMEDSRELVLSGEDYKELKKENEIPNNDSLQELKGWTAQAGNVRGRVVVCNNLDSFGKVRENDILVTAMTRPEYSPILKKVSAIVTDEGGVTCHAAIVSRELRIPCIVGTRIATQVLKDGDMVEVDADHGVVRRIG